MAKKHQYYSLEGIGFIAQAMPIPDSGDPMDFGCPACNGTSLKEKFELQQLGFDHYKATLFIQCQTEGCGKWYTVKLELQYKQSGETQ